jgi:gluconate kinase
VQTQFKKNKKRRQPITIQTEHGGIVVVRDMDYCWHCGELFGSVDHVLGLGDSGHRVTNGFTELITWTAQMAASFEDARELLQRTRDIEICASQIQIMTEEIGHAVYKADAIEASRVCREAEEKVPDEGLADDMLYIQMDGSAVNTRIQDKNGSSWKEMKLGMVFRSKDVFKLNRKNESCTITQKEYVTYFGSVDVFKEQLFAAAVRAGYGKVKNVVVIGDGAHWIWNLCDELFPDAVYILDYFHMAEHIHDYAKSIFPINDETRISWAKTLATQIRNGEYQEALEVVRASATNEGLVDKAAKLENYLENNKDKIQYKLFEDKDYYIGSGMIEGGNKVVIQKRMKQCGMRWSVQGGQCIASLRAKKESRQWNKVKNVIFHRDAAAMKNTA